MDRFFVGLIFALTRTMPTAENLLALHVLYLLALWPSFWIALRLFALVTHRTPTRALRRAFIGALIVAVLFAAPVLLTSFLILRGLLWLIVHVIGWVRRREPSTPRWMPWAVGVIAVLITVPGMI